MGIDKGCDHSFAEVSRAMPRTCRTTLGENRWVCDTCPMVSAAERSSRCPAASCNSSLGARKPVRCELKYICVESVAFQLRSKRPATEPPEPWLLKFCSTGAPGQTAG